MSQVCSPGDLMQARSPWTACWFPQALDPKLAGHLTAKVIPLFLGPVETGVGAGRWPRGGTRSPAPPPRTWAWGAAQGLLCRRGFVCPGSHGMDMGPNPRTFRAPDRDEVTGADLTNFCPLLSAGAVGLRPAAISSPKSL